MQREDLGPALDLICFALLPPLGGLPLSKQRGVH